MAGRVTTNAGEIARRYKRRADELPRSIRKRLREAAKAVNREALNRLHGGEAPGDYPVPVRSGNLLQGQDFGVTSQYAVVFNTSGHAVHIHEGQGSSKPHGRRPFLDDAVETVNPAGMVADGVSDDLMAVR